MTKADYLRKHRELWTEISRIISVELIEESLHCGSDKEEYIKGKALENLGESTEILEYCWCCEYSGKWCGNCLVKWKNENYPCYCCASEYKDWFKATFYEKNIEESKCLALVIANLPERED